MIDRRSDDRQSERDVHGVAEGEQLDRNQPLIVIAGDHHVKFAPRRANENRIAWKRTRYVDAALATRVDRRDDDHLLLIAKEAVFARMRVESSHGDPRLVDPKARHFLR